MITNVFFMVLLAACCAHAQTRVTGPLNEVLVFENVSFAPGVANEKRTRILGTVTNATGTYIAHAAIRVRFFDYNSRAYPRPSITCKFTTRDLGSGEPRPLGEKDLREVQEREESHPGLILQREPIDCNAFLRTLTISSFSLEIVSALHGAHVLTTVKPVSRLNMDTVPIPWDVLRDETEVEVLEFIPGMDAPYKVRVLDDGRVGYVTDDRIVVTPGVEALKAAAIQKAASNGKAQPGEREARLKEKYGLIVADRILAGRIWPGMTREMVLEVLGKPDETSRTLLLESVQEEWLYHSGPTLHFDNGILRSYEYSR